MSNELASVLLANRPNLSKSTVRTYLSIIRSLYRRIHNTNELPSATDIQKYFCQNKKKVLSHLEDQPFSLRKTVLAGLVSLCGKDGEEYRTLMLKDAKTYNDQQKEQKMTSSQKENWITQDQVGAVYKRLEKEAKPLLNSASLNPYSRRKLMDYVILSFYHLIPPRRSLDLVKFKVRNIDKEKDNYMQGRKMVFNEYKTQKVYGRQTVPIPPKLHSIISRWTNLHSNEYLVFNDNGTPMTSAQLTHRLNRIFDGKRVSVNMLRHSYITHNVLPNVPALKKLEDVAEAMGHSTDTQALYKKDIN
jgi:integrase